MAGTMIEREDAARDLGFFRREHVVFKVRPGGVHLLLKILAPHLEIHGAVDELSAEAGVGLEYL